MLTEVYLRADTRIDEQPVPIEATIGKDFFLQLARPATLGTPVSFGYWLNETYKTKVNLLILDDLDGDSIASTRELRALEKTNPGELVSRLERHLAKQGIPEKVQNLLSKALLAKITIIDLLIDGRKSDGAEVTDSSGLKLRFGLEVSFETSSGLDILPNIILDKVTLIVSRFPQGYKFPPRAPIPTIEPVGEPVALPEPKRAGGSISFSDNPAKDGTITLNGVVWTFVDKAPTGNQTQRGNDLGATIDALVANLKASTNAEIGKCAYAADEAKKQLIITFKEAGEAGKGFTLAADANSKGTPSGATLVIEEPDVPAAPVYATGWITFADNPDKDGTITLNGASWTFVDQAPAGNQTEIGKDLGATIDALVANLKASTDAEIAKCSYAADKPKKQLVITFKEAGEAGKDFTIAADAKSKGTPSGATLSVAT